MSAADSTLVQTVHAWIAADDTLKTVQKEVRAARTEKARLTAALRELMSQHDLDAVDLGTSSLVPTAKRTKAPLSKKYLMTCVAELFPDNAPLAKQVTSHILDNREVRVAEGVRRTAEKK